MGDSAVLSGIGLGNMYMNLVPYAILIGVNTALETLVSQAWGRRDLVECGLLLHRSVFIISCLFVPIAVSVFYIEDFFVMIGLSAEPAMHAQRYLKLLIPCMLMNAVGDAIDLFLIAMGYTQIVLYVQITVIFFHLMACWLCVSVYGLGIGGAAIASNLTALLTIIIQIGYMRKREDLSRAWFLPNKAMFQNLGQFIGMAMPGILMLTIENLNMEILVLFAGLMHSDDTLAACVMLVAFGQFTIMIPYGMALANVAMVGHALGANKPQEAKRNTVLVMVVSIVVAITVALILFILKDGLLLLYASRDNPVIISEAQSAFLCFIVAMTFDWTQCNTSGVIKAAGL